MLTAPIIRQAIVDSLQRLQDNDSALFGAPILGNGPQLEEFFQGEYDSRKLHEVCINHRLASYLEDFLKEHRTAEHPLFFDLEFNKKGVDPKELDGEIVRPDIIVHNRKDGTSKENWLIVECKKSTQTKQKIKADAAKIESFMKNPGFHYVFGLQVIYGEGEIETVVFFQKNAEGEIVSESLR